MKVQYSPSKPEVINLDSDDSFDQEIEGENIDTDFKDKLLDLFGKLLDMERTLESTRFYN